MARGLERYILPWEDGRRLLLRLGAVLLGLFVYSLFFFQTFSGERETLIRLSRQYASDAGMLNRYVYRGMPPFWMLAWRYLTPFPAVGAVALCAGALNNYLSCRFGARCDYTLRRLPDRWEYHRRCLVPPVLEALSCLLLFALLTGLYYLLYLRLTPPEFLLPAPRRFWG